MIAQSQSGTGKTAAFVITILSRLDYTNPKQPQALVLAPSRELARQIEGVVRTIGQYVPDLLIQGAVPGAVTRNAKVEAAVIVGTPGTVLDLIKRRQLDASKIKIFVMDEADNMCMLSFLLSTAKLLIRRFSGHARFGRSIFDGQTVRSLTILALLQSNLRSVLPASVQILLFSATFPDNVTAFANQFSPDANQILLEQNQLTVAGIKQMVSTLLPSNRVL